MRRTCLAIFATGGLLVVMLSALLRWSVIPIVDAAPLADTALLADTIPYSPQVFTFVVTSTQDSAGMCGAPSHGQYPCPSLRSAIITANGASAGSIIQLTNNAIYNLTIDADISDGPTTGDLNILKDMTFVITGCTSGCRVEIRGKTGWADRLLHVQSGAHLSLYDIVFTGGFLYYGNGGAILIDPSGTLTMTGGQVVSNYALDNGGGIENDGALYLDGTLITHNRAHSNGAGLANESTVWVTDTSIISNTATYSGGGVYDDGTLLGQGVIISDNVSSAGDNKGGGGLFVSATGQVTLTGGALRHNYTVLWGAGFHNEGRLTLNQVTLEDNSSDRAWGGGGYNGGAGTVTINGGQVINNLAYYGGGLYQNSTGLLSLLNVSVLSNTAPLAGGVGRDGGGLYIHSGPVSITGSLFSANTASGSGGAIYQEAASVLTLTNSTLSNNNGATTGGLYSLGSVFLNNVTIAQNPGGGVHQGGSFDLGNTLIGGNSGGDCSGSLTSHGYNLIQNTTNCTLVGDLTGVFINVNPLLGALKDNGGSTRTHMLLPGSPAIDAGNPAASDGAGYHCQPIDQRGHPRPIGLHCDIGAYEAGYALYLPALMR